MSNAKSKFHRTDLDNLISHLRGEVGEIVDSWVLMKEIKASSNCFRTGNVNQDFQSTEFLKYLRVVDKFKNDIISRLSELAETTYGQINFYFVSQKLQILQQEVKDYRQFIKTNKFLNLRHEFISHKALPATWQEHKAPYQITDLSILKALAKALGLVKEIDKVFLGYRSKFLWYEMRKKRYDFKLPFSGYTLLPHLRLPENVRIKVANKEEQEGKAIWSDECIKINESLTPIKIYKELGLIKIGNQVIAVPVYPIKTIENISFSRSTSSSSNDDLP